VSAVKTLPELIALWERGAPRGRDGELLCDEHGYNSRGLKVHRTKPGTEYSPKSGPTDDVVSRTTVQAAVTEPNPVDSARGGLALALGKFNRGQADAHAVAAAVSELVRGILAEEKGK